MEGRPTENNQSTELSTIRDILMGNHIEFYAENFQRIADQFDRSEAGTSENLQALEQRVNDHFAQIEKQIADRFDKLEELVTKQVDHLNQRINNVSNTDKVDLGKMLAEVSQRLLKQEE